MAIRIIDDLRPRNHYADGSPIYSFSPGGFPSRGVRRLPAEFKTPEEAMADGVRAIREYEARDPMGNMGCVCGVLLIEDEDRTRDEDRYAAVINIYHSNT